MTISNTIPEQVIKHGIRFSFTDIKQRLSIKDWYFDVWQTNLGYLHALASDNALFSLRWTGDRLPASADKHKWFTSSGTYKPDHLARYKQCVIEGDISTTINIELFGTPFQCHVWRKLLDLGEQQTISYSELARMVGCDKGQRAIGTAVGANPVFLLVPCHRVVASNGKLGGYAYGLELKQRILDMEQRHQSLLQA